MGMSDEVDTESGWEGRGAELGWDEEGGQDGVEESGRVFCQEQLPMDF